MSKENDKIFRTLEHIAITFDKLGCSPTIPIFKGHQDFEWLFKLELDTIKALCNQQDQKIIDLEAKLAEKDETIKGLIEQYKYMEQSCSYQMFEDCQKQIEQLKQQLAEKDRAIENWETMYKSVVQTCHNDAKEISRLREQLEKKDDEILKGDCAFVKEVYNSEQDKISFTIEQLVTIQKYISDNPLGAEQECFGREINNYIDNQIKQLKEME